MKYEWREIRDSWVESVVLKMMGAQPELTDQMLAAHQAKHPDGGPHEFRVLVNGVEYDFDKFVDAWSDTYEGSVARHATDVVAEKLRNDVFALMERLEDPVREIERALKDEACKLLGYDPWERR